MTLNVVGMFCEDIREEKSGQISLIGILPDNINIASPPLDRPMSRAAIPKLALFVRIHIGIDYDVGPMSLQLTLPDERKIDLGAIERSFVEKSKKEARAKRLPIAGIISRVVLMNFQLPESGIVTAILEAGQEKHICAVLNAQIMQQVSPAPTASEPPASQSESAS